MTKYGPYPGGPGVGRDTTGGGAQALDVGQKSGEPRCGKRGVAPMYSSRSEIGPGILVVLNGSQVS